MIFLLILMGLMINMLIGLTAIALVDDQKHSLLVLFQLWPLVLIYWFSKGKK